ncbi:putative RNA-binding protein [Pseudocercospora fuligena]|uniref:Putative RNA-binding protein n=1 Tax=Pseudocercospora fuligena TaxID=685502 RepID=A0A8H6VG31_9PEZI|nr:putative RNA-binding protein [Pseudocercospora fuligena]
MSQEENLDRNAKKALRDAERQKKGKKRKHAETEEPEAVPAQDAEIEEEPAAAVKKEKSKKRKSISEEHDQAEATEEATTDQPKKKKRRKAKSEEDKSSKNRFIVFVGNLPYKTTDSSLDKHFAKLKPYTLRHRTDPKTKKSKGFAFLEFENYDRMKTCLKLYHHSLFDPEAIERGEAPIEPGAETTEPLPAQDDAFRGRHQKKKKETARRINVELTAGGGGKTDERKEKIKAKNAKLDEERKRRAEEERKAKEKQAKKDAKAGVKK